MMTAYLAAAAAAVATPSCPTGRPIVGVNSAEVSIYDLASQAPVGRITSVKGQISPSLTIDGCAGRYFLSHLEGKQVAVPRLLVVYSAPPPPDPNIMCTKAGASDTTNLAGMHASDPMYCPTASKAGK